ncbi:ABC transporter permease subunit [Thermosipho africanus]|uniref:ABC transporter permease subunit n=1 Tax=Thermosipho africanus TaxID=2421 RepID=UPI0024AF1DAF|nr:ABC transporter permease subunit [Thermosipho africanus]
MIIIVILFILIFNIFPIFYGIFSSIYINNSFSFSALFQTLGAKYFYISLLITILYALFSAFISTYVSLYISKLIKFNKFAFIFLVIGWTIPPYIGVPVWRTFFEKYTDIYINPITSFISATLISSWFLIPFTSFFLYTFSETQNKKYLESFLLESNKTDIYYKKIVVPNIKGAIYSAFIFNFLKAFKDFQVPWLLTEGGAPLSFGITDKGIIGATTNLEVLIYKLFNFESDISQVSSISLLTILIITSVYFLSSKLNLKIKMNISYFSKTLSYLWIFSIIYFFYILLTLAFSDSQSIYLKGSFTLKNFKYILDDGIVKSFSNTLLISIITSLLSIILSMYFAYFLLNIKNGENILNFFNFLKIFSGLHIIIFIFYIYSKLRLLNTFTSVILMLVAKNLPFLSLLSYHYFKNFPEDLFLLAKLDNIPKNTFFFKILLPNSFSLVSSLFLLSTLNSFNAFLPPLVFLFDESKYTLSIKLYSYVGAASTHYPLWNLFGGASFATFLILLILTFLLLKISKISYIKYL